MKESDKSECYKVKTTSLWHKITITEEPKRTEILKKLEISKKLKLHKEDKVD